MLAYRIQHVHWMVCQIKDMWNLSVGEILGLQLSPLHICCSVRPSSNLNIFFGLNHDINLVCQIHSNHVCNSGYWCYNYHPFASESRSPSKSPVNPYTYASGIGILTLALVLFGFFRPRLRLNISQVRLAIFIFSDTESSHNFDQGI